MLSSRRGRALAVALFTAAVMAAFPGGAAAAEGDFLFRECHTSTAAPPCNASSLIPSAYHAAVSPDGRHAYVSSWISPAVGGALTIWDRNPATGALTQRTGADNCYRDTPDAGDCTDVESMGRPLWVEISPDGKYVYVASWLSNGIAVFNRNAETGQLTQKNAPNGCIKNGGDGTTCKAGRALGQVISLWPSPDGKNLYAASQTGGGAIAILSINSDGELSQQQNIDGCVTENGNDGAGNACTNGQQIGITFQLAVSPDGSHVYSASSGVNAITLFNRDQVTGGLTQKNDPFGCISQNGSGGVCQTDAHLSAPNSVNISADGKYLYVGSFHPSAGSVLVFERARPADGGNGLLTFKSCFTEAPTAGCTDVRSVSSIETTSISPDGKALAVHSANTTMGGLSFFDVEGSTGGLIQRAGLAGCATKNGNAPDGAGGTLAGVCTDLPAGGGEGVVEFINNRTLNYASFGPPGQVTVFDRDFAPVCQPATVAVPFETAVAAPLNCSDANSHPITLEIVTSPTNGVLGGINTTANTVSYDPFGGFIGTDSFTFRGTAAGVSATPATVTLNVSQNAPPAAVDADGDGFPQSNDCNDSNASINPGATDIPGNGVDEDCSGADGAGSTVRPRVTGDGNAGTVRVNKRRFFKLAGHRVNCSGAGPNCTVRNRATARVDFAATSALRNRRIGGSRFTVRAGRTKGIKVRLTKKAFKALKREGKLKAKTRVTVTRGDQQVKRRVKVKLKPPRT